jgi:hypothetical protein
MSTLLQPQFIILLFVLVRSGDIAIGSARARDTIRALCYGIVAILAIIAVVIILFGLK